MLPFYLLSLCVILKFDFKKIDNNHSGSRQITYFWNLTNDSITNSDINSLRTLNATLLALLQTYWLDTLLLQTRWSLKISIYRSVSASFTTSKKSQLDRSLYAPLLPSVSLCYPQIQFTNNVITTLLDRGKSPICANEWKIQLSTLIPTSLAHWTPYFWPCCTQTDWIQY